METIKAGKVLKTMETSQAADSLNKMDEVIAAKVIDAIVPRVEAATSVDTPARTAAAGGTEATSVAEWLSKLDRGKAAGLVDRMDLMKAATVLDAMAAADAMVATAAELMGKLELSKAAGLVQLMDVETVRYRVCCECFYCVCVCVCMCVCISDSSKTCRSCANAGCLSRGWPRARAGKTGLSRAQRTRSLRTHVRVSALVFTRPRM